MRAISRFIDNKEFMVYLIIGAIATVIDWSLFTVAVSYFDIYYQISLCISVGTATMFHYMANKLVTFKCSSKKIASQVSVYGMVSMMSLFGTMAVMCVLVNDLMLTKIMSRIATTGLMVLPNYLLHKYVSFNKKIFS